MDLQVQGPRSVRVLTVCALRYANSEPIGQRLRGGSGTITDPEYLIGGRHNEDAALAPARAARPAPRRLPALCADPARALRHAEPLRVREPLERGRPGPVTISPDFPMARIIIRAPKHVKFDEDATVVITGKRTFTGNFDDDYESDGGTCVDYGHLKLGRVALPLDRPRQECFVCPPESKACSKYRGSWEEQS